MQLCWDGQEPLEFPLIQDLFLCLLVSRSLFSAGKGPGSGRGGEA